MLATYFNDREPNHINSLQSSVQAIEGIASLRHKPIFANKVVGEDLVKELESIKLVPTLAFVDPFGYKGLSTRLVNAFVERNFGTDCIFFFNYNRISMGINNELVREHMAALFGQDNVDKIRAKVDGLSPHEREMAIVGEIASTLKYGGSRRYVVPFSFRDEKGSRTSHHLILVSKHQLANKLIKDVMREHANQRRTGIAGFTYNPAVAGQSFLAGFDPNIQTIDRLAVELPTRFQGRTASVKSIFEEDNIDRPFALADYKEVLKQLEAKGRINTNPPAANRRKIKGEQTMGDDVRVSFP
jgi:three-Cys-motif partner protein